MTTDAIEPLSDAALLAWQVAMGADEAIADMPLDCFIAPKSPDRAQPHLSAAPTHAQTGTPDRQPSHTGQQSHMEQQSHTGQPNHDGQPILPVTSGPRTVTAKPAQSIIGAGPEAAAKLAASANTLEELRDAMNSFDGGHLKRSAKNLVFSDGVAGAPLMIVGEAPGADEDRIGKPFVGVSGQLLDRMLEAAGYSRSENVYISNVIPWRPLGNRTPDPAMVQMCLPFIRRHIELAAPKLVLMLGGVSAKALLESTDGITRLRGRWRTLTFGSLTIPAIAAYHPAYLLRQPQLKGVAWRDFLTVKHKLAATAAPGEDQ